jgi:hypothetical protein
MHSSSRHKQWGWLYAVAAWRTVGIQNTGCSRAQEQYLSACAGLGPPQQEPLGRLPPHACWNLWRPAQRACSLYVHAQTTICRTDGAWRGMWQYVVKPSRTRLSGFGWHRDRDWCCGPEVDCSPYLSIWIALDDMHAGGGPLHATLTHRCVAGTMCLPRLCLLLPALRPPATWQRYIPGRVQETVHWPCEAAPHATARTTCCWRWLLAQRCARLQHWIALKMWYCLPSQKHCSARHRMHSGCSRQASIRVCGSAQVILSDSVLHSSQANASLRSRRAWMPQFSCRPIRWQATGVPVALAIPVGLSDQMPIL